MNNNIIRSVTVTIDMNRMNRSINTKAVFNQRDVETAVILCYLNMGGPLNLSDCTVMASILKPDTTNVTTLCQILDEEKGLIAIGLNEQCLSAIGEVRCELSIHSETQVLYSPVLIYNVIDNLFDIEDSIITSQNDYPILSQLITQIKTTENRLKELEALLQSNEDETNSSEYTRGVSEIARIENENNRLNNELKRNESENIRKSNELNRDTNESLRKDNEVVRQKYIEQVKVDIRNMTEIFDSKNQLISSELERINTDVNESIDRINSNILEFQNRVNQMSEEIDEVVSNKMINVDEVITNKMSYIDSELSNELNNFNGTINTKMTQIDNTIIDIESREKERIQAEKERIQAEKDRETNYNSILSSFIIVNTDIDDILNMIGGDKI